MTEQKHRIWSDLDLDYEDWRADLEADYPELTEDERMMLMHEINGGYLDDERANLNIQLDQPILIIADLGLWTGRHMGYKEIASGNIRDCLYRTWILTTPPGTLTGWATCAVTPSTTTAPITCFTAPTNPE